MEWAPPQTTQTTIKQGERIYKDLQSYSSYKFSTPGGVDSDDDVYDLYTYTVASTPASESYQSACSSSSNHNFNEEDFEYQLGLAIARYDAKPRRWAGYEQGDGPDLEDSALVRRCEVEEDLVAKSVSCSPQHEQWCTAIDGG